MEVLQLLWFTVVVHHFITSATYGICEAPPSVRSGLPRTTYFTDTQNTTVKLRKLIQIKKIYVSNLINYYPVYIPS